MPRRMPKNARAASSAGADDGGDAASVDSEASFAGAEASQAFLGGEKDDVRRRDAVEREAAVAGDAVQAAGAEALLDDVHGGVLEHFIASDGLVGEEGGGLSRDKEDAGQGAHGEPEDDKHQQEDDGDEEQGEEKKYHCPPTAAALRREVYCHSSK